MADLALAGVHTPTRHLWETPVEHEPWPLADATVDVLEETLTTAAGLPAPLTEPVVHFSPGVRHVRPDPPCPAPQARPGLDMSRRA
ncbi:hypothetical protein GCM10027074_29730 [Streptomyces deserti]